MTRARLRARRSASSWRTCAAARFAAASCATTCGTARAAAITASRCAASARCWPWPCRWCPSLGLKSSVLSARASAAGAREARRRQGGAAAGGGALSGSLGSAAVAKVALVSVLAGGGLVAGEAAIERAVTDGSRRRRGVARGAPRRGRRTRTGGQQSQGDLRGERRSAERSHGRRGRSGARRARAASGTRAQEGSARARARRGRKLGQIKRLREELAKPGGRARAEVLGRGVGSGREAPAGRRRRAHGAVSAGAATESETLVVPRRSHRPAPRANAPGKVKLSQ